MQEYPPKNHLTDLNYYNEGEPWRKTRKLAHEVIRAIGTEQANAYAAAHWVYHDQAIQLFEKHEDAHAHYALAVFPPSASAQPSVRYRFSSAHPRIKYAYSDNDLETVAQTERTRYQDTINELLYSGLSHLSAAGMAKIADQMHTDSAFWEQAVHATLFTAHPHQRRTNGEVGEVTYHTSTTPALGRLAYNVMRGQELLESHIDEIAHDVTRGTIHARSPELTTNPITVRDVRTVRRVLNAYIADAKPKL